MMAEKARLFNDPEVLEKILSAKDPKTMKVLGREVKGFTESIWRQHRVDIVTRGNLAKFSQNPTLGEALLHTGDAVIAEASPRDRIWGIGLGVGNAKAQDPKQWRGQNLLGKALMEVRRQLVASTDTKRLKVQEEPILIERPTLEQE